LPACIFRGDEAEEWLGKGLSILAREVPEQVLDDGGHFERSPMYHSIILEDLLDLLNVFGVYGKGVATAGSSLSQEIPHDFSEAITKMLGWMNVMAHPDGGIGFF